MVIIVDHLDECPSSDKGIECEDGTHSSPYSILVVACQTEMLLCRWWGPGGGWESRNIETPTDVNTLSVEHSFPLSYLIMYAIVDTEPVSPNSHGTYLVMSLPLYSCDLSLLNSLSCHTG